MTVRGKTAVTPIKSADPAKLPTGMRLGEKAPCINELYAGMTKARLSAALERNDHALERRLGSLQRRFRDPASEIQLCFLEYKDDGIPSRRDIELMTDIAHGYSDMTPLPMLSGFTDRVSDVAVDRDGKRRQTASDEKRGRVTRYLSDAIETIEQLNDKPIMGYVPDYRLYFDELVGLYADKGINTFYFDAHQSNPVTLKSSLRALMRTLAKRGVLEQSFVHMINPGPGRTIRDGAVVPARDILGFGLGIDSLGERHMQMRLGPQAIENMRKNPDNRSRLFDKDAYGYLKTASRSEIERFYPGDSSVDMQEFTSGGKPDGKVQNAFNVEQLALEGARLRDRLASSEPILEYVSDKGNVSESDIKVLKRAKVRYR